MTDQRRQEWSTPDDFMMWVRHNVLPLYGQERFALDLCATEDNRKAPWFIGPPGTGQCVGLVGIDALIPHPEIRVDGLDGAAWCNPGYKKIAPWIDVCADFARRGMVVLLLTHAQHSTAWHRQAMRTATSLWFINPRINFVPAEGIEPSSNSKDSLLWVFCPGDLGHGAHMMYPAPWRPYGRK